MNADKQILEMLNDISNKIDGQEKPLNLKEAAEYLGISESYLYKLTSGKKIPFYKPHGKLIYFKPSDLYHFVMSNRINTKSEIEFAAINRCLFHHK